MSDLKGIGLICSYQESFIPLIRNSLDKFYRLADLVNIDKEYVMNGFSDEQEIAELVNIHLSDVVNLVNIDSLIVKVLLQKTFRGVPLFVMDLVDSLLEAKLIQIAANQLVITQDLVEIDKIQDWKSFNLPIRYEKLLGSVIDSLISKEIIIMKHASVIGNIFDLEKLNKIIPFNNITLDDLYLILQKLEVINLLNNYLLYLSHSAFSSF